jgi:hypothetical protein
VSAPSIKSRRVGFAAALVVVIATAVAIGNAQTPAPAALSAPEAGVVGAAPGEVWFCPGLPPAVSAADARVTFANTGTTPAELAVTVLADKGKASHRNITVAASSVLTPRRAELGPAGALTIETFGGPVLVEEGVDGPSGIDMSPCATQTATQWHFAAGTTVRGVQQWLVIENPYASDAKVDVTLRTSGGLRRPEGLQGFDIARRSRAVVPIHDHAVRDDRVAVEVEARIGSIVAAQTLVFGADAGGPGIALTLGAPAASDHWVAADGATVAGATGWVAISNDGVDDAQVAVQAVQENGEAVAPVMLGLAQDEVTWVQVGNCPQNTDECVPVPAGARYSIDVRSDRGVPVVAQTITRSRPGGDGVGAATTLGATRPAAHWGFATSRVGGQRSTMLAFVNPLAQPAHVRVALVREGRVDHPESVQAVTVPPGRRVTVSIVGPRTPPHDAAVIVDSSGPVFVERSMTGAADVSRSSGIPLG